MYVCVHAFFFVGTPVCLVRCWASIWRCVASHGRSHEIRASCGALRLESPCPRVPIHVMVRVCVCVCVRYFVPESRAPLHATMPAGFADFSGWCWGVLWVRLESCAPAAECVNATPIFLCWFGGRGSKAVRARHIQYVCGLEVCMCFPPNGGGASCGGAR